MKTEKVKHLLTPARLQVIEALENQAYFVGGAVRDLLQNRPVHDVDMTTPFSPDEITARLASVVHKIVPTGIDHGTLTLVLKDKTVIELTSFRADKKTDGRHASVAFGTDMRTDALRRDFTMNALYLDKEGTLFDFTDGLTDLKKNRLRFIGDPSARIAEDALRILRYFRFYAQTQQQHPDTAAVKACQAGRSLLVRVSKERQKEELFKLLSQPLPYDAIHLMARAGVLKQVVGAFDLNALRSLLTRERRTGRRTSALFRLWVLTHGKTPDFPWSRSERGTWQSWSRADTMPLWSRAEQQAVLYLEGQETFLNFIELKMPHPHFNAMTFYERLDIPMLPFTAADVADFFCVSDAALGQKIKLCEQTWLKMGCPDKKEVVFRAVCD